MPDSPRARGASPQRSADSRNDALLQAGRRAASIALPRGTSHLSILFAGDGTILWCSPSVTPVLGYDPEAVVGDNLALYMHPDDREASFRWIKFATEHPGEGGLDHDDADVVMEVRIRRHDGRYCNFETLMNNMLATEGVNAILAVARETTGQRVFGEMLSTLAQNPTSSGVLKQMVAFLDMRFPGVAAAVYAPDLDPVWVTDQVPPALQVPDGPWAAAVAQGRLVVTERWQQAVGQGLVSMEMARIASSLDFVSCWAMPIPPPLSLSATLLPPLPAPQASGGTGPAHGDALVVWSRRRPEPLPGHLALMERVAGLAYLSLNQRRELAHQHQRLAEEQERSRRLLELDELRSALIFSVSHELRTPVTSIIGFAELAQDAAGPHGDPEVVRHLDVIARNAQRLLRLTGDLMMVGQLQSGTLDMNVGPADVGKIVHEAVAALRPEAVEQGIDLRCSVGSGPLLAADAGRIGQLVDNLVSNAIKYSERQGQVEVIAEPAGPGWKVTVADQGMGIPHEDQPRLFDQFFRASNARASSVGGSGLGLSIVQGIAELHQGRIEVHSTPGRGSRFTVTLYDARQD